MKHLLFLGIAFATFHVCRSNTPDFCRLPSAEGEGTNFNIKLFYNITADECNPFVFKGQGGNDNRFDNEIECIRNCSVNAEKIYPMDASEACHFKKAKGRCNGKYLMYYYDSVHKKCKTFFWTGCVGNGNRFRTIESCNSTCTGIHDEGDEPEEDESDTPIAIICGVLLAVIIAIIITVTIVLTVKSKKKSSKKKAAGKSRDPKLESPLQEQGLEMS
uniref:BPTI/Kunitz domain-containing protein n=1 Tax=Scatophagus argus TaxID=75038 RepID=UPI001ED8321B|nr:BPTI/Kunitz domain-containing protein [Scatophagus argus]